MKKRFIFSIMLASILALGLAFVSCDDSNESSSGTDTGTGTNLFNGTSWSTNYEGVIITLSFTSTHWILREPGYPDDGGTYTFNGNVATLRDEGILWATATISGNTLRLNSHGEEISLTRIGSNPPGGGDIPSQPAGSVPTEPRSLFAVTDTNSTISLGWTVPRGFDLDFNLISVTGYNIYRSETEFGTYTKVGTTTSTHFTDTGLFNNRFYYYKVSAYNEAGEGPLSEWAGARTAMLPGTSRETAARLHRGDMVTYYFFPPGADEVWLYIVNQGIGFPSQDGFFLSHFLWAWCRRASGTWTGIFSANTILVDAIGQSPGRADVVLFENQPMGNGNLIFLQGFAGTVIARMHFFDNIYIRIRPLGGDPANKGTFGLALTARDFFTD